MSTRNLWGGNGERKSHAEEDGEGAWPPSGTLADSRWLHSSFFWCSLRSKKKKTNQLFFILHHIQTRREFRQRGNPFSHRCDQIPDRKQLPGERVHSGLRGYNVNVLITAGKTWLVTPLCKGVYETRTSHYLPSWKHSKLSVNRKWKSTQNFKASPSNPLL